MKSQPATAAVPLPSLTTLPLVSELTGIDCIYGPTVVPWYTLEAVRAGQPLPAPVPDRFGSVSPCCSLYSAIWLRSVWTVLRRLAFFASLLAELNCGITIAARMPRMITTIRISIRVKPRRAERVRVFITISPQTPRTAARPTAAPCRESVRTAKPPTQGSYDSTDASTTFEGGFPQRLSE